MTRTFAVAAILTLTVVSAQAADSLAVRVHNAAVASCAVESSNSFPASHYAVITNTCVDRISAAAMRRMDADAQDKMKASTASN